MMICRWFIWFVLYSMVGWLYESTLCSITGRKLVNRGFLNGRTVRFMAPARCWICCCLAGLTTRC